LHSSSISSPERRWTAKAAPINKPALSGAARGLPHILTLLVALQVVNARRGLDNYFFCVTNKLFGPQRKVGFVDLLDERAGVDGRRRLCA
jgi:hypothetical protein